MVIAVEDMSASQASSQRQPPPHSIISAKPTPVLAGFVALSSSQLTASVAMMMATSMGSVFMSSPLTLRVGRFSERIGFSRRNSTRSIPRRSAHMSSISSRANVACGLPKPLEAPEGGLFVYTNTASGSIAPIS